MKTSLERQLVQYNQLRHKYWMNGNNECRVDAKRNGEGRDMRVTCSPHTPLLALGYL